uniref:Drug/Metabolite Transporter (DMT) Superfamily putative n=1 Tax=Albugo laibachii Nc14 TaxID=890382 RepID=F0VZ40_9STRA|nr:Drug/Metabolite Transporter (DMT) Superfamily putative [Albugo laibachii Nc14]|eukprot:CCA14055.1 Drug/Metabolite Transporter (DMT) Superfamily putative [Albugo laibachii Nc14]
MTSDSYRWTLGIFFIVIVAFIWTFASVLVQYIFHNLAFQKPFFLTFVGISLFSVNLPIWYLSQRFCSLRRWESSGTNESTRLSQTQLPQSHSTTKLCWKKIIRASAIVAPLWFLANFTYNASLDMTSVTSSTIISSTSTVFTLFLSVLVLQERFTWMKMTGVVLCMMGNMCTIFKDSMEADMKIIFSSQSALGDFVALFAAFMYGVYTTAIRKLVPDEAEFSLSLFFGFLGALTFLVLSPVVVILHYNGIESLHGLTWEIFQLMCVKGLFDNVLSDYLWAQSVIMTSPTVATVGLSLTVPLAIVSDLLFHNILPGWKTILASLLMVTGFVLINVSSKRDRKGQGFQKLNESSLSGC